MSFGKKLFSCLSWITVISWSVLGVVILALVGTLASGIFFLSQSGDEDGKIGIVPAHSVGVVELSGEIMESKKIIKDLDRFSRNKEIKALVVKIDSPGGAVGASEEIFRAIKRVDAVKPVICSLGNIAASGGLYASMGCRKIYTQNGTLTGSIGVIMMMPNVSEIVAKLGFQMNIVKSGRFKDTGSPFRKMTEDDQSLIQGLINQTYEQFVKVISESRKIPVEDVKKFADGRIILGEQSVALKLADVVGDLHDAANDALTQAGEPNQKPHLVYPPKKKGIMGFVEGAEESVFFRLFRMLSGPKIYYLALS
ncbi:signal peptide peptidase SppA [bacterium]|nr:signal peptide peptidase SppA [bacterium]